MNFRLVCIVFSVYLFAIIAVEAYPRYLVQNNGFISNADAVDAEYFFAQSGISDTLNRPCRDIRQWSFWG